MKKIVAGLLLPALLLPLLLFPASAEGEGEVLTVQTRSGEYRFGVGEVFTYNYWLELSPEALGQLDLSILPVLDAVSGNIMYDRTHLELVDKSMPCFRLGLVYAKSDVIGGSLLDGTVLDFSDGDVFFKALGISDEEAELFRTRNVLVSLSFRVVSGSPTPVYLRTKLKKLDAEYAGQTFEFIDNKNSIALLPFASYETVNDAAPQKLLDPYVGDQGFDIRCCLTADSTEYALRPGAGVAVTLRGVDKFGTPREITQYSGDEDVFWFYDIPYGEYFVSCSYVSDNGVPYGTPKLSKGEYVSIPSTGIVQALWLFEASSAYELPDCPVSEGIAYADGIAVPFVNGAFTLDRSDYRTLVVCTYNADVGDVHTLYPLHLYVWMLSHADGEYRITRCSALDDVLQYAGSSIRLVGKKGIRMITGIPEETRRALIGGTLNGCVLQEYGTVVAWDSELGDGDLTLDAACARPGAAYIRNTADPIYRRDNGVIRYTNVLVGFTNEQCAPDLVMRPYMKLKTPFGETLTLYGGTVRRSIGYIAYQNRSAFSPGDSAYDYIWDIIHSVYGDAYDAEYQG